MAARWMSPATPSVTNPSTPRPVSMRMWPRPSLDVSLGTRRTTTPALRRRSPTAAAEPTPHARPMRSATSATSRPPRSRKVTIAISPPVFARTSNAILFSRSTVPGSRMPAASTTTSAADVPYPRGAGGNSSCWETAVSRLTANFRNNAFLAGIEIRRGLMCALECRNTTSFSHLSLRQDSITNQLNRCFEMTRTLAVGSMALALILSLNGCSGPEVSEGDSQAVAPAAAAAPLTPLEAIADTARIQGNPAAKVWLVMASDFQCPACKHWHDAYSAEIMRDYVATGKIRFAYINFPLDQHMNARPASEAGMCAAAQGK